MEQSISREPFELESVNIWQGDTWPQDECKLLKILGHAHYLCSTGPISKNMENLISREPFELEC